VTVNGTTVHPGIYYTSPAQIAAVLPANTPAGTGTITVTYNNETSAPVPIKVVATAFGISTYNGNTAVVQDSTSPTGALYTPTNSAKPGGFATVWGTGFGADPGDSDTAYTTSPHTISTQVDVYVGGVKATDVRYAGASVYPGVHILVFVIPTGVPNGCFVPIAVVTGGNVASNMPVIPVMNNGGTCSEPLYGFDGAKITSLRGLSNVRLGTLIVGQTVSGATSSNFASAVFNSVAGSAYGGGQISPGTCSTSQVALGTPGSTIGLDAGPSIGVAGPGGSANLPPSSKGFYSASLAANAISSGTGSFTFTGPGGTDVGQFSATVNLPNPALTWTNQSAAATINRAQGLTVNWTGGGSGSYLSISGNVVANGISGNFFCSVPVAAGSFTVPGYVLALLPAGSGFMTLQDVTAYSSFSANGIDLGYGVGYRAIQISSTYQ
jgi:uncharacterized protein (TIGR03437 family)